MKKIIEIKKVETPKKITESDDINSYIEEAKLSKGDLLNRYNSSMDGLDSEYAKKLLIKNGKNIAIKDIKRSPIYFLLNSFKDHFIIILLFLLIGIIKTIMNYG